MAKHDAHATTDGNYRWVEGAGGLYRHSGGWDGHSMKAHPADAAEEHIPLPVVVLRCRCDDPDSHAQAGEHCPEAEIDLGETFARSLTFNPGQ